MLSILVKSMFLSKYVAESIAADCRTFCRPLSTVYKTKDLSGTDDKGQQVIFNTFQLFLAFVSKHHHFHGS